MNRNREYCYRGQRVIVAERSNLWVHNPATQSGMPGKGQQGVIMWFPDDPDFDGGEDEVWVVFDNVSPQWVKMRHLDPLRRKHRNLFVKQFRRRSGSGSTTLRYGVAEYVAARNCRQSQFKWLTGPLSSYGEAVYQAERIARQQGEDMTCIPLVVSPPL